MTAWYSIKPFGDEPQDMEFLASLNQWLAPLQSTRRFCHRCCFENIEFYRSYRFGYDIECEVTCFSSWMDELGEENIWSSFGPHEIEHQYQILVQHPLKQVQRFLNEAEFRFSCQEARYLKLWG